MVEVKYMTDKRTKRVMRDIGIILAVKCKERIVRKCNPAAESDGRAGPLIVKACRRGRLNPIYLKS